MVFGVVVVEPIPGLFDCLEKAGLRAKKTSVNFIAKSVTYLGHKIHSEGLHPLSDKVKAILNARSPANVLESRAYLGLFT